MKLWIRACGFPDHVRTYASQKDLENGVWISLCRRHMSRLLRGTGKRLPKHGSDEIVEIEVTAR